MTEISILSFKDLERTTLLTDEKTIAFSHRCTEYILTYYVDVPIGERMVVEKRKIGETETEVKIGDLIELDGFQFSCSAHCPYDEEREGYFWEYLFFIDKLKKGTLKMLENLIIITNESGGMNEYEYEYFKEGFEEWAKDLDALPTEENLRQYLIECGYKVKEIKELD